MRKENKAYTRKSDRGWQAVIRKKNHPHVYKTFFNKGDASRYAQESEIKINNHKEKIDCVEIKKPNVIVSSITGDNSGLVFQCIFGTFSFIVKNLL